TAGTRSRFVCSRSAPGRRTAMPRLILILSVAIAACEGNIEGTNNGAGGSGAGGSGGVGGSGGSGGSGGVGGRRGTGRRAGGGAGGWGRGGTGAGGGRGARSTGTPTAACPVSPATNAWNTDISGAPVDPNSANYINSIGAATGMHPDFGTNPNYGIPYITVPG